MPRLFPAHDVAAIDLFRAAVPLFNAERAERVKPARHAGNLADAVVNLDLSAISETRQARPLVDDGTRTFLFKREIEALELFEKIDKNLDPRLRTAGRQTQGGRAAGNFFGERLVVHVDANADDHHLDAIDLGLHLGKYSAYFLSADQQIVGPFDIDLQLRRSLDGIVRSDRRSKSQ